jgi:signal transduction histidine kinase
MSFIVLVEWKFLTIPATHGEIRRGDYVRQGAFATLRGRRPLMSPQAALQLQIDRYRQLTPSQRLRIGLELHDLVCKMSLAGIKRQHPHASEEQRTRELVRRLKMARR